MIAVEEGTQTITDEQRFDAFYHEHEKRLGIRVHFLMRNYHQAEEVLQITWIKVAKAMPSVTREVTYGWVYRIAQNTAYDFWRAEYYHLDHIAFSLDHRPEGFHDEDTYQAGDIWFPVDEEENPETLFTVAENEKEDAGLVDALLAPYTRVEREALLSRYQGERASHTAQRLGIEVREVNNVRHNILQALCRRVRRQPCSERGHAAPVAHVWQPLALTQEDARRVKDIYAHGGCTYASLAQRYGVSKATIQRAVTQQEEEVHA